VGEGAGARVDSIFNKFSQQLGGNYGRKISPKARGSCSLDVAEKKFPKREPALSPCRLGKFIG
jgi:hypothetical protein